jgi:hypothetical protein
MGVARALFAAGALCAFLSACAADNVIVHDQRPRGAAGTVASDMLWGGVAGGAVGGALIGYKLGVRNQHGYDWVPVLVTGVGVGLAGGFLLGVVDALSARGQNPERPEHDGMSLRDTRPADLSREVKLPLWAGRF